MKAINKKISRIIFNYNNINNKKNGNYLNQKFKILNKILLKIRLVFKIYKKIRILYNKIYYKFKTMNNYNYKIISKIFNKIKSNLK